MKTLHIISSVDIKMGGTVSALMNILRVEKNIGMDATVVTLKANELDPSLKDLATFIIISPSFPARFSRSKYANLWLHENARSFDIAFIHSIWGIIQIEASRILHHLRIPFSIWPHAALDPFDLQKKKYLKKILGPIFIRPMLDNSKAIICTTKLESERLERYGATDKTRVLPLPISPLSAPGDRERFRKRYLLTNDDFVLLFLSRIDYKKGLNLLIPSLNRISSNHPNIKLIIAGSDTNGYKRNVRAWIREYELEDRVIMSGFLSGQDRLDAFAGSECFVLPSMNENFGIAIVEALSAGLPVLISDHVYIWKEIIQSGGGWVCNYSIESLSDTITMILSTPSDLIKKKENAKRSAEQFSTTSLEPLYKELYNQLSR